MSRWLQEVDKELCSDPVDCNEDIAIYSDHSTSEQYDGDTINNTNAETVSNLIMNDEIIPIILKWTNVKCGRQRTTKDNANVTDIHDLDMTELKAIICYFIQQFSNLTTSPLKHLFEIFLANLQFDNPDDRKEHKNIRLAAPIGENFEKFSRVEGSALFSFTKDIILVSYIPKKRNVVLLVSSMHHNSAIDEEMQKSEIITYYSGTKGGIDALDEKLPIILLGIKHKTCIRKYMGIPVETVASNSNEEKLKTKTCHACDPKKKMKTSNVWYLCKKNLCLKRTKKVCLNCAEEAILNDEGVGVELRKGQGKNKEAGQDVHSGKLSGRMGEVKWTFGQGSVKGERLAVHSMLSAVMGKGGRHWPVTPQGGRFPDVRGGVPVTWYCSQAGYHNGSGEVSDSTFVAYTLCLLVGCSVVRCWVSNLPVMGIRLMPSKALKCSQPQDESQPEVRLNPGQVRVSDSCGRVLFAVLVNQVGALDLVNPGPIICVEGTHNKFGYESILCDHVHTYMLIVFPWEDGIFQHDNAPHGSTPDRRTTCPVVLIRRHPQPPTPQHTLQLLWDTLQTAWLQIAVETYQYLTESLPAHLDPVHAVKGSYSEY
ncbi:hypothetical protein PR048_011191 [Dryococelus australis]|uniref:PiggyBac transposable element-derived protein domain-containing protein n=1 Tax=Dryococelus australis TaxID=614101 RepID=A0ABQ9HLE2_9NEOP|nr:hypothetical protein PR048_011191 [Dryococelus australis]